jgi:hypothetical protein
VDESMPRKKKEKVEKQIEQEMEEIEEPKGFEIKCLKCGGTNCSILEDGDFDEEGNWFSWGYYIQCNQCDNNNR